ncbi:MAG: hypothetical protein KKD39_08695 [Candidatus Altiarchaeota archaeon]|nr:hypothetical protein [Candidatus Altiarchaeota archaeon]
MQRIHGLVKERYAGCIGFCGNTEDCINKCFFETGYNNWIDPSKTIDAEDEWLKSIGCVQNCEDEALECVITCSQDRAGCEYTCSKWVPDDGVCRGGYQTRDCDCNCDICPETPNLKLCPVSQQGFINLPLRSGSYGWADPVTGETKTVTSGRYDYGEYKAEPATIDLTGQKPELLTASGVAIDGLGLHVGEASTLYVDSVKLPGVLKPTDISVVFIGDKESVLTSTSKAMSILKLEFKVRNTTEHTPLNMTLKFTQDRRTLGEITLKLDIQPLKDTLMKNATKNVHVFYRNKTISTIRYKTTTTTMKKHYTSGDTSACNFLTLPLIAFIVSFTPGMRKKH